MFDGALRNLTDGNIVALLGAAQVIEDWVMVTEEKDRLSFIRGILVAIVLGLCFWIALALVYFDALNLLQRGS